MSWPNILQNIQSFVGSRLKDDQTLQWGYCTTAKILIYPTCKFLWKQVDQITREYQFLSKKLIQSFYLEKYKTTNNPSIKETQMQPLFFVYIFVVRTQKSHIKGNYENRLACWQVIQVAYRMFIRFTSLLVFIHVPDTILTNTCCCT